MPSLVDIKRENYSVRGIGYGLCMCSPIQLRVFCLSTFFAISAVKKKILYLVVILGFSYENHVDGYIYNFNWVHYEIRINNGFMIII